MSKKPTGSGAEPDTNARDLERYRPYGDRLLPLQRGEKMPLYKAWPDRRHSFEEAMEYARQGFNIGIKLGNGLGVLDYDPRNDPTKDDPAGNALIRLCRNAGVDLSKCWIVDTGGGGQHVYMKIPRGTATREGHPDYPGVEFKHSPKRQVVCAGSRHPSGKLYRWRQ